MPLGRMEYKLDYWNSMPRSLHLIEVESIIAKKKKKKEKRLWLK